MDDRAKVAKLAQTYGPRIYSLALRMCGNDADAQDVVQDTFLQAHRKWKQFRGDSDPGTWLYTIAARRCKRAYLGKRARGGAVPKYMHLVPFADRTVADVPLDEPDGVERQVRREEVEAVEQAIARLPADFRLPLGLTSAPPVGTLRAGRLVAMESSSFSMAASLAGHVRWPPRPTATGGGAANGAVADQISSRTGTPAAPSRRHRPARRWERPGIGPWPTASAAAGSAASGWPGRAWRRSPASPPAWRSSWPSRPPRRRPSGSSAPRRCSRPRSRGWR